MLLTADLSLQLAILKSRKSITFINKIHYKLHITCNKGTQGFLLSVTSDIPPKIKSFDPEKRESYLQIVAMREIPWLVITCGKLIIMHAIWN